jgi:hypothetical protein
MKRKLSGIFLWEKINGESVPVCFEDCSKEKQEEFMNSLDPEGLKNLARMLAETIKELGDMFDLVRERHE